MLATEAARLAQKMSGKAKISPADMRDAMEAFSINETQMASLACQTSHQALAYLAKTGGQVWQPFNSGMLKQRSGQ